MNIPQQIKHELFRAGISDKTIDTKKLIEASISIAIALNCSPSKVAYDLIILISHFDAQKKMRKKKMAIEEELKGLKSIICEDCGTELPLQICHSNAGYYLGHHCPTCGPYSRETGYFRTKKVAEDELFAHHMDKLRNTKFTG